VQSAVQATRGQTQASLKSAGRAFDMAAKQHLLSSPNFVDLHRYTAEAYLRDGQPKLALDRYEKYLARQEIPPDSPAWVAYLRLGGWAYLDAGLPKKALPALERALKLSAAHPFYPGWTARLRYQLARALLDTRGDRKRAESLAQAAHDELANDSAGKGLLAEVDAWRAKAFKPSKPRRRGRG
jgi:tetratricopeptide (TPR) repeat protein